MTELRVLQVVAAACAAAFSVVGILVSILTIPVWNRAAGAMHLPVSIPGWIIAIAMALLIDWPVGRLVSRHVRRQHALYLRDGYLRGGLCPSCKASLSENAGHEAHRRCTKCDAVWKAQAPPPAPITLLLHAPPPGPPPDGFPVCTNCRASMVGREYGRTCPDCGIMYGVEWILKADTVS